MSNELLGACAHLQLPPSEKAVLMSLADQSNADGVSWPSVNSLAEYTCLSERTVQRSLRELQERDFLTCDLNAVKSNRYRLNKRVLVRLKAERDAAIEAALVMARAGETRGDTVSPQGCHGVTQGDMVSPQGCHSGTQTIIEPNTNTPHTPQAVLEGLQADAVETLKPSRVAKPASKPKPPRRTGEPVALATWLAALAERDEDAITPTDAVWVYAETVGLSAGLLALCWAEFKRRMSVRGKRQKDWRQTFRNYVEGNYFGLWLMRPGQEAVLSSKGEQAQRWHDAQPAAQQQGEEVAA